MKRDYKVFIMHANVLFCFVLFRMHEDGRLIPLRVRKNVWQKVWAKRTYFMDGSLKLLDMLNCLKTSEQPFPKKSPWKFTTINEAQI